MEIENLLKQRELLDEQILDVKTEEIRKSIAELQQKQRLLQDKLSLANLAKKSNDSANQQLISQKRAELEELQKVFHSDCYFVSQIDSEIKANGRVLTQLEEKLSKIIEGH
jgi:hypothetical protein